MSDHRRYLVVLQDPRGYPPQGQREPAPPNGPAQPALHSAVLEADYEVVAARLRDAEKLLSVWAGLEMPSYDVGGNVRDRTRAFLNRGTIEREEEKVA